MTAHDDPTAVRVRPCLACATITLRHRYARSGAPLLAFLALILAAPAATADLPTAGGQYWYHEPPARLGTDGHVRISVDQQGTRAYVSWTLNGRTGCSYYLRGRSVEWFNSLGGVSRSGATGIKVTVKADGSFSGALHRAPAGPTSRYMREYLAETHGRFLANGVAQVSIRLRYLDYRSASYRYTCDGRWLKFRAGLEQGRPPTLR